METIYKEVNDITEKYTYKWVGYGIDAQSVFTEYVTRFNIAKGIITSKEFTGRYIDCYGKQVKFYR